jgi:polyribonucleotide nucleotidyltransferase
VLQLVLSWGGVRSPDALAITAAGAALAISDIPCAKPVAGARVGWPSSSPVPIVNPTMEQVLCARALCVVAPAYLTRASQMADSKLDLVIAGTSDAVLMIEGFCSFLSEEQMLQAVEAGHATIGEACTAIAEW